MTTPFRVTVRTAPAGPELALTGELDFESAPEFRSRLDCLDLRAGERLVLDLSGLEFCDSSGLSAFIAAQHRATDRGATLAVVNVPPAIRRLFRVTGLDQFFHVEGPDPA